MTTDNDLILGAIADGCSQLSAIAKAVELDVKTVSNRLYALKQKGRIERGAGGWTLAGGCQSAPTLPAARLVPLMSRGDEIPQFAPPRVPAEGDEPPQRKPPAKANGKRRPKPVAEPQNSCSPPEPEPLFPRASAPIPVARELEFAVSESGAVLFKTLKSGELGEINCADALALYRLMSNVEFIRENA